MATLWEENLEPADVSEVHWSPSTILAIFLAASLVSAVFFGLGYSFGRGGTAKPALNTLSAPVLGSTSMTKHLWQQTAIKPASPEVATASTATPRQAMDARTKNDRQQPLPAFQQVPTGAGRYAALAIGRERKPATTPVKGHSAIESGDATLASAAHYMVQVGAVGDRKDARMLVSQLRKRGFHAGIYSTKRDKFLHVQIGPFANVQQAQTMRHHVMANGYRAILKHAS